MRLDDLVEFVNKRVTKEKIRPADSRARAKVTARTIQFYVNEGLIPAPARRGGRLEFTDVHVEAILEVKRQQAAGKSLEEITEMTNAYKARDLFSGPTIKVDTSPLYSRTTVNSHASSSEPVFSKSGFWSDLEERWPDEASPSTNPEFRWHIALGNGYELFRHGASASPRHDRRDSCVTPLHRRNTNQGERPMSKKTTLLDGEIAALRAELTELRTLIEALQTSQLTAGWWNRRPNDFTFHELPHIALGYRVFNTDIRDFAIENDDADE